jgi:NAD(P)-dependent dehydrogenase (short-subunit alcohol dehydrogenase family)
MSEAIPTPTSQEVDMSVEQESAENKTSFVAPLEASGITSDDLQTAVKVLQAVAGLGGSRKRSRDTEEPAGLTDFKHSNLRPLRKALTSCLTLHQQSMYEGKSREEFMVLKEKEKQLKRRKNAEAAQQRKFIAGTALRKGRIERMKEKQSEAQEEEMAKLKFMIPDGHVETNNTDYSTNAPKFLTAADPMAEETNGDDSEGIKLPKLRSCYVCKDRFRDLHHFYDQLCPSCASLNWEKRHQTADLDGKVAVVTGSRVKIGYQTCLKLLRAGATVVATSRFPNAAAATYRKEADFSTWQHRLQVYGLDLRDVTGLEAFCRFLKMKFSESGVDMLINNACQTVRRPTAYYLPACQTEEDLWQQGDKTHKQLLGGCLQFEQIRRRLMLDHKTQQHGGTMQQPQLQQAPSAAPLLAMNESANTETTVTVEEVATSTETGSTMVTTVTEKKSTSVPFEHTGMSHSAAMSQMVLLPEDAGVSDAILPPGVTDINGQQLDLRKTNSWLLKMEQVSTPEVMECMFINAIAPFVLNSRLKPLMSIPKPHEDRYVINVSAMEGKFYRYKMPNHPHTNMAKAALNMMTRTSAEDLAKNHGIFMVSVDTGWINDENPLEKAHNIAENNHFQTPIDEVDAAARILDPIFTGINHPDQPKDYGKFLKDYRETEW